MMIGVPHVMGMNPILTSFFSGLPTGSAANASQTDQQLAPGRPSSPQDRAHYRLLDRPLEIFL
ncbi:MAG: hypothetical protein AUI96_03335 [Nitrospirae bacterium 13_1_40CM_3_62_11]|nr:MAG: hypothetical protein AUI96_03335 [Nitrospirae bacterium 13_1_40CM_3_62_11]